jgi:hypothetical protein
MTGRPRRRRDLPNYEHRARFWRDQIAAAATPQEQYRQVARWLHAVARRASAADRDRAFTEAAREVAEVTARLEERIAPQRDY